MSTTITSRSESIQMIYTNYVNNEYWVNRRYQRKLVWTINEKAAFIDSIIKSYSVPLFLFAQTDEGKKHLEIIDGMQRLNAICSFLENEFPVKYEDKECYFDLDILVDTKDKKDQGILYQKQPVLPREICLKISNYQLPISSVVSAPEEVEEIFQRINAYGKKLSEQEIRQAGALGRFPELVRKISANIRGDVSCSDMLSLEDMKKISITNHKLNYGIDIEKLFWVENNIVTKQNIRVSRDEELIAYMVSYILLEREVKVTSHTLNILYALDEDNETIATKADDAIEKFGFDNIINNFNKVFDTIVTITKESGKKFKLLIFNDEKASGLVRTFQVVFLALYELMIKENMRVANKECLIKKLDGIGICHLLDISSNNWNETYRYEKITAIKAILKECFVQNKGEDVACENWVTQLENLLNLSLSEGGQYDFKHGFYTLDNKPQFDKKLISECIKTLTATVNKAPHTNGYIIVGVCDKLADAERTSKLYGIDYKKVGNSNFYVTGLNCEIDKFHSRKSDSYLQKIKQHIRACTDADEYTRHYILTNMKLVSYYGMSVLVLNLLSGEEPISFGDKFFVRENDETIELTSTRVMELANVFYKK